MASKETQQYKEQVERLYDSSKNSHYHISNPSQRSNDYRLSGVYKGQQIFAKGTKKDVYKKAYGKMKYVDENVESSKKY